MFENVLFVLLVNASWIRRYRYVAGSGFPLIFLVIWLCWSGGVLPTRTYVYDPVSVARVAGECLLLAALADAVQTAVHALLHGPLRATLAGRSHGVHHLHTTPTVGDAFHTGPIDAIMFVTAALFAIGAVGPDRTSVTLFGAAYSWHLHFIHSSPHVEYPRLDRLRIVTPKYHHAHHSNPRAHFSSLFACF